MHRIAHSLVLCSLLALCACDRWPPHQQDISDHFYENDAKLFALRSKLLASEYSVVSVLIGDNLIAQFYDESIGASRVIDEQAPQNAEQWVELFSDTHVTAIGLSSHGSQSVVMNLFYYSGNIDDDTHWKTGFVHDPDLLQSVTHCSRTRPSNESGTCAVELSDDWWIQYWWEPVWVIE